MNARDELFQLILGRTTTKAVERILAAGYRKPRTITTAEELDRLAIGAVIRTSGTDEYEPRVALKISDYNGASEWDVADCDEFSCMSTELDDLPATVLYEPDPSA